MNSQVLKFRKKPVVIDAILWTGNNLREVITFTSGAPDVSTVVASAKWADYCDLVKSKGLIIKTLEGEHIATVGDWIIKGVKGECYPCKPDIFELTYDVATLAPIPDALQASAMVVPVGWKLVPVEPTAAQCFTAAFNLCNEFGDEFVRDNKQFALSAYRRLVAASPAPGDSQ